jgi:hypothetical protein
LRRDHNPISSGMNWYAFFTPPTHCWLLSNTFAT